MSENRRAKRRLLQLSKKGRLVEKFDGKVYADNKGDEYPCKWIAAMSSFYNIFRGCMKNGFPIVVPKLWYTAWAFYPFFFVRKNLSVESAIPTLNHERIHIRQQRDIHITISLPLIILSLFAEWFGWFNNLYLLCIIPFIPTLLYGIEMLRTWRVLYIDSLHTDVTERIPITFKRVRENTCFERESISRATNADYLFNRKFWAVLAYTGWNKFKNYGIN